LRLRMFGSDDSWNKNVKRPEKARGKAGFR
jgi:hypothetical protein